MTRDEYAEADKISKERRVLLGDALHAIIARDNDAILVSQDKHFQLLKDVVYVKRPEQLI